MPRLQGLRLDRSSCGCATPCPPEIHDDRVWRFDWHTAASSTSGNPASYEYPVTEIAEVLGEYAELAPCLGGDLEVRFDASSSVKASALHSTGQRSEQLDVLGRVGRKGLHIATVEGVNAAPGNPYVFLRHRLPLLRLLSDHSMVPVAIVFPPALIVLRTRRLLSKGYDR